MDNYPNIATEDLFTKLNQNLNKIQVLTPDEIAFYNSKLTLLNFPKKHIILQNGNICLYEYYILKGCIRIFYIDNTTTEVNINFASEDFFFSDFNSFHNQQAAKTNIQCLEDCTLLAITFQDKEEILERYPKFERIFRLKLQNHITATYDRLFHSLASDAENRYKFFLEKYPQLNQRIAQHHIASYLGISPEFLSKLRKKMLYQ